MHPRLLVACRLLAVILLVHLFFPGTALANMAKPSEEGEVAGILEPQNESAIRIDRETLAFDVQQSLQTASVKAVYTMTSTAGAPLSFDVAFVHIAGEREPAQGHVLPPALFADDRPVPFRTESGPGKHARGWTELSGSRPLVFLMFHLDFAPGQTRTVRVEYTQQAGWDRMANVHTTYTFDYLLSPAKHWASFGPLDVEIHLPPGTRFTSPTTAFADKGDLHVASFATLPPGELRFSVMSTAGLWLGLSTTAAYFRILVAALVLTVLAVGAATGRLWTAPGWRSAVFRTLGAGTLGIVATGVVSSVLMASFPGQGLGYGGFFAAVGLMLLSGPISVALSFSSAKIRSSRRRAR